MNLRKFAKDILTKLTMHSCTFTSAFEEQNAIIWNYYENVFKKPAQLNEFKCRKREYYY